ncbi:Phytosulfokine [Dillenia turbinata]|uniref:Phytosulfokine n=1 Tax=Dillenia turbinata TaxID=194707 RepID=A0AAN8V5S5_9MAGN
MSKFTTLLILVLLICSTLTYASRPLPDSDTTSPVNTEHEENTIEAENIEAVDESCEGVGEEECLTRRTLAAHIDYIYTQNKKP